MYKMVLLTVQYQYDPIGLRTNMANVSHSQTYIDSGETIGTLIEKLRYEKSIPRTTGVNIYANTNGRVLPFSYTTPHEAMELEDRLKEFDEELWDEVMHDTKKLRIIVRLRIHFVVVPDALEQCQADLKHTKAQLAIVSQELARCQREIVRLRKFEIASMFSGGMK